MRSFHIDIFKDHTFLSWLSWGFCLNVRDNFQVLLALLENRWLCLKSFRGMIRLWLDEFFFLRRGDKKRSCIDLRRVDCCFFFWRLKVWNWRDLMRLFWLLLNLFITYQLIIRNSLSICINLDIERLFWDWIMDLLNYLSGIISRIIFRNKINYFL